MILLRSVDQLLEHIKLVEEEVMTLSKDSLLKLSSFIEENQLEVDEKVAEALQYQDIISQQLSATIEAIENVQQNIAKFNRAFEEDESIAVSSIQILQDKLNHAVSKAEEKRKAFTGNVHHEGDDEAIEFF